MNIMAIFISGAVTALVTRAMLFKNEKETVPVPVKTEDIDFDELTERIEALSDLKEQLYDVENMITEIEAAEQGERGIVLNLTMPTVDTKYNFLVNNQSEAVLELIYAERKKLRFSIVNELSKITIRSTQNVCKTFPKSTEITKRGAACND
ncbi:MAG: hypothetical protein PUE12_15085 [Oscillospiraceae bacterium]|nr:hypothetical protein [Oscillospiraceae bacterium]